MSLPLGWLWVPLFLYLESTSGISKFRKGAKLTLCYFDTFGRYKPLASLLLYSTQYVQSLLQLFKQNCRQDSWRA